MVSLTRPEGSEPVDFAHTRRGLAGLFFAGYALAAVSAEAEPIVTDGEGLTLASVAVPSRSGGALPLYVARPSGGGRHPAVIVVSEVFGVHEYIRDVCRRLAKAGYVAVAPAFFFRAGDPAGLKSFPEIIKIVETAHHEQTMGDIEATLAWLNAQTFVDRKRIGITGFCWGGAVVWMAAARFKAIRAGVAWYGRLSKPKPDAFLGKEERPWPLDVVRQIQAPVLGLYAGEDQGIPQADVDAMRQAMAAAGKVGEIIVYPGAKHGFHADYREQYDAKAAQDGWARMLAFFAANGLAPGKRRSAFDNRR